MKPSCFMFDAAFTHANLVCFARIFYSCVFNIRFSLKTSSKADLFELIVSEPAFFRMSNYYNKRIVLVMSSNVWKYFEKVKNGEAQCLLCPKKISCKGSSTSALIYHANKVHKKDVAPTPKEKMETNVSTASTIKKFCTDTSETLGEIFAKCVAIDGMSILKGVLKSSTLCFFIWKQA